jgi:hypothetical protein
LAAGIQLPGFLSLMTPRIPDQSNRQAAPATATAITPESDRNQHAIMSQS